ncbi:pyrimidine dimer DNA glycosylase/endonuclease V [Anaerorhabdus sp.]|uniref:pyrimidine dimer DNA glycosylase/endonuclease V n=1 Tax=Anaerorhabdus sp. TaxID=1872524 RepID=UPI002FC84B93
MRLWHKDLIHVLPRQQLLAQWRELCSIYAKEDKHILINFIYEYSPSHLYTYSNMVITEMENRGYKLSAKALKRYTTYFENNKLRKIPYSQLFKNKMNDRYLIQCYNNLQEKYDCGGINKEEWEKIENEFSRKQINS